MKLTNIVRLDEQTQGIKDILKDGVACYNYAKDVLKGPFPEGERQIGRSILAFNYVKNILHARFKLGEYRISKIAAHWMEYITIVDLTPEDKLDILTSSTIISNLSPDVYNHTCKAFFPTNKILQNKWIRYGEQMRNQQ